MVVKIGLLKPPTRRRLNLTTRTAAVTAVSTSGTETYNAYLSAVSDDFNDLYVGSALINWVETYQFQNGLTGWSNNGSNVTSAISQITPTSLAGLGVKLTAPLYVDVVETR